MKKNIDTLYQWPKAKGTESIYPRCVVIHHIYRLAKKELQTINVSLPKKMESFDAELQKRLLFLPVVKSNGIYYNSTPKIMKYLLSEATDRMIVKCLERMNSAYNLPLAQWANEVFINSLVYSRWKNDDNFERFIATVDWGSPLHLVRPQILELREGVLKYLSRFFINELNQQEFMDHLYQQLWSLDRIISDQKYFDQNYLTLTDLYIHMIIQGYMSDSLAESKLINENCDNLVRWYHDINREIYINQSRQ